MNKNIDPRSRMVSGPINVLRLEGDIHGIKKVLYLFLDYHADVSKQTECQNIFSEDVQKYFANTFYELNSGQQIYDFFLEIFPTEIADNSSTATNDIDRKDMYIEEVVKLFKKLFKYDPKKNRVMVNNLVKNVRLHYIDIRDYYKNNIHNRTADIIAIASSFMSKETIKLKQLSIIIKQMRVIREHLENIVEILESTPSNKNTKFNTKPIVIKPRNYDTLDTKTIQHLARKLKSSYKYPDVQKIMNQLLDQSIDNFKSTIQEIDETIKI